MEETKVPNTPQELLEIQNSETLLDRVLAMFENENVHPCDVVSLTQSLSELCLWYHVDYLKDNKDELEPARRVAWEDDVANLTQAVKYLGRVRR